MPPLRLLPLRQVLFSLLLLVFPLSGSANDGVTSGFESDVAVLADGAETVSFADLTAIEVASLKIDQPSVLPDTTEDERANRVEVGGSVRVEAPELAGTSAISNIIRQVSDEWIGTPYRWGGNTRRGIDCSAFVQTIMRDALDLNITRTTASQVHEGESVRREDLLPGDLVFFRRRGTRHVGIYLGNDEFIHASSSRGVTISNLSQGYYNRHYWTSRRIIDNPEGFLNSLESQGITPTSGPVLEDQPRTDEEPSPTRRGPDRPSW